MIQPTDDVRMKQNFQTGEQDTQSPKQIISRKKITLAKAFGFAFHGLFLFFKRERNGKIQLSLAALVTAFGIVLHISPHEWIYVLLCIAAVLSLEMLNSAVEKLCDLVCPDYNPTVKIIKDVSAGAVLWTSLISIAVATIIFLPKIIMLCFPK